MNTDNINKIPVFNQDFVVVNINDTMKLVNTVRDKTVIITDGWVDGGDKAAVLRGGINAYSVLNVFQKMGLKEIKIYHIEEKILDLENIFLSTVVENAPQLFENANISWRRDHSIYELIKNIASNYKMLFFGAPLAVSEIIPFYRSLKQVYPGNIAIVRGPTTDMDFEETDQIYKWVRKRTFDASDFSLCSVLRNYKKRMNKKIAVILPSLNEEKTVSNVIEAALEVKDAGIIDEVILVDSGSQDNTVNIAKSYHIPVYLHQNIKPEIGTYHGKGEAMFKSLFVTDADIVAWVDTDIETISPKFFYGLFGPILSNPNIKFVKGYFARPIHVKSSGLELGGGRVTELLVRPLINSFLPELSGYIQPLAGTVAIYRDCVSKMKIPTNYGVEISMLIQIVKQSGLWSTCQVNLGEVIHRSKDVLSLSEMSFQILNVLGSMQDVFNTKLSVSNTLRRVYSSNGKFEIGIKKFNTYWRSYE